MGPDSTPLGSDPTPQATSELLCSELRALSQLSGVALVAFVGEGMAIPLSTSDMDSWEVETGSPLARALASYLSARAFHGPWIEHLEDHGGASGLPGSPKGPGALVCAPLWRSGAVLGLLIGRIEARDDCAWNSEVACALSHAVDVAGVGAALLEASLRRSQGREGRRAAVEMLIRDRQFVPVFQPMVRLRDGQVVGYEALTRFTDGSRPDLRFAEAARMELGVSLELATMGAAVQAASVLPEGAFLSLNVSPDVAMTGELHRLVASTERPLVLELSQHDQMGDGYRLRQALDSLTALTGLQVSVGDVRSGFAKVQQMLAVRPQFMKLDPSWVSGIHADPAVQALVAGLVELAGSSGCRIIAQGIEADLDLHTLQRLDVELGQGFLFGHPEPEAAIGTIEHSSGAEAHPGIVRVLLVDDDPTARHLMRLSLELERVEVVEAASLGEARLLLDQAFDGVILDRRLPDGDGLDLLPALEEHHPGVQVVVCSNLDDHREPVSVTRVPKTNMDGIVHALGLAGKRRPSPRPTTLPQLSRSVTEQWHELCRQHPMVPLETEPPMAERVVAAVNAAVDDAEPGWLPDPGLETVVRAFAESLGSVESAVGQLLCLREALRRHLVDQGPGEGALETLSRIDMVGDACLALATAHIAAGLRQDAVTDSLTGLLNHRAFERDLGHESARASRYRHPFSVLVIDLDGLKAINDEEGHAAGDEGLRSLARALSSGLRATDSAYRVGGDEFTVLLPGTGKAGVASVVKRAIEAGAPSFSWGAATFFDDAEDGRDLVDLADQRLYDQRRAGRSVSAHR